MRATSVMAAIPDNIEGWRVLVLGGTGLIGSHVVRSFSARGAQVRVLVRPGSRRDVVEDVPGVDFWEGDLGDIARLRETLDGCHVLVHSAAPYPIRAFGRRKQIRRARESIINIMEAARYHAGREFPPVPLDPQVPPRRLVRIVYVSAPTTIAPPKKKGLLANEEGTYRRPPDWAPYFHVKEFMEREFRVSALLEELPVVIVNPTLVVDAYDSRPTTGQLLLAVAQGRLPFVLRGDVNVVPGRDVGEGVLLAAFNGEPGQRYILGGENMTLGALVHRIAHAAGVRPPKRSLPLPLAEVLAWLCEVAALLKPGALPLLPINGLHLLKRSVWMDASRAKRELGWQTTAVNDAIRRAFEWFYAEGKLKG